jgi:hypothetical protein
MRISIFIPKTWLKRFLPERVQLLHRLVFEGVQDETGSFTLTSKLAKNSPNFLPVSQNLRLSGEVAQYKQLHGQHDQHQKFPLQSVSLPP